MESIPTCNKGLIGLEENKGKILIMKSLKEVLNETLCESIRESLLDDNFEDV